MKKLEYTMRAPGLEAKFRCRPRISWFPGPSRPCQGPPAVWHREAARAPRLAREESPVCTVDRGLSQVLRRRFQVGVCSPDCLLCVPSRAAIRPRAAHLSRMRAAQRFQLL